MAVRDDDRPFLARAVELAAQALDAGDMPFGSLLVSADGRVLREERNRVGGGNQTLHPELALAQWAPEHLEAAERAETTCYTSGEHCPMCSAAHAWAGLGRIVYASSARMYADWLAGWGVPGPAPVASLPIGAVAPQVVADGPDQDLAQRVKALHLSYVEQRRGRP